MVGLHGAPLITVRFVIHTLVSWAEAGSPLIFREMMSKGAPQVLEILANRAKKKNFPRNASRC